MTADELLRRYPREALRWLRQRLGLSQADLALRVGANLGTPSHWEAGRRAIGPANRKLLAALLKPHLATPDGEVFLRSLGGAAPPAPASPVAPGASGPPTTRAGLRAVWRAGGKGWEEVPEAHRGRNLAIARAYLGTDEPIAAIAARHGVSLSRVPVVARTVVYHMLGRRPAQPLGESQSDELRLPPRHQVGDVRAASRLDERGGAAE